MIFQSNHVNKTREVPWVLFVARYLLLYGKVRLFDPVQPAVI